MDEDKFKLEYLTNELYSVLQEYACRKYGKIDIYQDKINRLKAKKSLEEKSGDTANE